MQAPTAKAVAEGIHACIEKGHQYLEAAEILLKSNHSQGAGLLAFYCLEEFGKVPLLWNCLFYTDTEARWKRWRKRFKDHEEKFWFSNDLDDFAAGGLASEENEAAKATARLKQDISYVSFGGNRFSRPTAVTIEQAAKLVTLAQERLRFLRARHASIAEDKRETTAAVRDLRVLTTRQLTQRAKQFGLPIHKSMGEHRTDPSGET